MTATSLRNNAAVTARQNLVASTALPIAFYVVPGSGGSDFHLVASVTTTFTFTVTNNATGPDGIDLLASHPGAAITIVSVNGVAGDSARILSLGSGASQSIAVVYSIGNVAAGTVDTLVLKGRSLASPATSDNGFADLTVIRPILTIAKAAFRDDKTTPVGAGTVLPGEFIQYRVTVTNGGSAVATTVHVDDALPAQLTFASTSPDAAGWTLANVGNSVTADLSGSLAVGASRFFGFVRGVNWLNLVSLARAPPPIGGARLQLPSSFPPVTGRTWLARTRNVRASDCG